MYFPHISKSWNPNIMRCVSTLYFRQIMTALHFLCIGARWRVLPLINNWCHQVLMYWFTISSTLCRTNIFLGGNMITHRPRNRNKDKVAWWGQARANPSSAIALHQQWVSMLNLNKWSWNKLFGNSVKMQTPADNQIYPYTPTLLFNYIIPPAS